MKKNWRKILSVMLALIMVVTLIPFVGILKPIETKAVGDGCVASVKFSAENVTFNNATINVEVFNAAGNSLGSVSQTIGAERENNYSLEDSNIGMAPDISYAIVKLVPAGQPILRGGIWVNGTDLGINEAQITSADGQRIDFDNSTHNFDVEVVLGVNGGGNRTYNVNFGEGKWTIGGVEVTSDKTGIVNGLGGNDVIKLTNFDGRMMAARIVEANPAEGQEPFTAVLSVNGDGEASVERFADEQVHMGAADDYIFEVVASSEGGQGGGQGADVKINLGCPQDYQGQTWTGTPMINHKPNTTFAYADTYKMNDNNSCQGVRVYVLEDNQTFDGAIRSYADRGEDGMIHFNYHGNGEKRKIVVASQWSDVIEVIRINGNTYTPYSANNTTGYVSNNSPMDAYMANFAGQMVYNVFEVDVNLDAETDDPTDEKYDVQVAMRPLSEEECKVGNFLWSDDESCKGDDMYVEHATLTLEALVYNGQGWDEEQIVAGECPYVGSYHSSTENHEGRKFGEMFVPTGAEVIMKVTPETGYQVESFNLSGSDFVPGDEAGVFAFTIGKGNFHLGASTVPVENTVKATATSVSDVQATVAAGGQFTAGSANLSIANTKVDSDKKSEFATAAGEQEVDLIGGDNAYLAIDLDQVIYKAKSKDDDPNKANDVWTQEVHDLGDGYAEVTMTFGNDVDVSTVVLLHNIGDGEDFETIRPISYDASKHTATFRIKSFSTFAIAQAHTKTVPVTPSNTNTNTNTNTNGGGSGAPAATTVDTVPKTAETFPMALLIVLSIVSLGTMATVVVKRRMM